MVTQITLGNFYQTADGKNVLGGAGGSGLDTETLLNALTEAKKFPAVQDQNQITKNGEVTDSLNEFNTLLANFQLASDALRNPPGVGNAASNAFLFTTGSVTSNTAVAGTSYMNIITSPGATIQNYTINEVTSVATTATQSTTVFSLADINADSVVSSTPGGQQFAAGTLTVNGQDILFEEGDTLGKIAAKFNAVSANTGIAATVIKISDGSYQLSLSATATGSASDFDLSAIADPDNVLTNIGFNAAVGADDAVFQINGVSVTRSSNSIDDVIDGVTFNLVQATPPGTTLDVKIKPDTTTVQNSIVNFAKAYNALKEFEARQTQLKSDGTYAATAVLANNSTFRNAISQISADVSASVGGLSGVSSLADIGITFVNQPASGDVPAISNIINIDDGKLTQVLATDYNNVRKMFGFTLSSNNPNLGVFKVTNGLSVTNFTLNIDPDTNTFEATYNLGGRGCNG
jgi:flagellar hook-associated protein 2